MVIHYAHVSISHNIFKLNIKKRYLILQYFIYPAQRSGLLRIFESYAFDHQGSHRFNISVFRQLPSYVG